MPTVEIRQHHAPVVHRPKGFGYGAGISVIGGLARGYETSRCGNGSRSLRDLRVAEMARLLEDQSNPMYR